MINLAEQIREMVAKRPSIFPGMARSSFAYAAHKGWSDRSAAAILAVLDEHRHLSAAGVTDPLPDPFTDMDDDVADFISVIKMPNGWGFGCTMCHRWHQGSVRDLGWCRTVKGIAYALGIEYE